MTVHLLFDKEGNVKRVYTTKERASEDLDLVPDGKVEEFHLVGARAPRVQKPRLQVKREKVQSSL